MNDQKKTVNLRIQGGNKLSGSIKTKTSKNAAVAFLAASLLNEGKTTIKNIAKIEEVNRHLEVLESIGVKISWDKNDLILEASKINLNKIDKTAAEKTRSVFLYVGALIHRFKNFKMPPPGGCKLGSRTLNPHLYALEELGIKIRPSGDNYEIDASNLRPAHVTMYETSDTATENVLLAAAKIPGKTTITFAAANYMVQETCLLLEQFGVKIEGIGTPTLVVHGVEEIKKDVIVYPAEDPIDSMLFISAAITTGSELLIQRAPIDFLELELYKLKKMGLRYETSNAQKADNGFTKLIDIKIYPSKITASEDKIEARPYPGINIDNLPFFVPIATQATGQTLIHDWVYEDRALYYMELKKMGADLILADPHRLFVKGPTQFKAIDLMAPPALRPAAIIMIAMLAAEGKSTFRNIYSILRGYEDIASRLKTIGADIEVFEN